MIKYKHNIHTGLIKLKHIFSLTDFDTTTKYFAQQSSDNRKNMGKTEIKMLANAKFERKFDDSWQEDRQVGTGIFKIHLRED